MGVKLYTRRDLAKLLSIGIVGNALESQGVITRSALALRGAMMAGGKKLPYDAEVEWIDNQDIAGSFIDLGVKAYSNCEWYIGFGFQSILTSTACWGAANDAGRLATAWITVGGAIRYGGAYTYGFPTSRWEYFSQKNIITIKQHEIILNGSSAVNLTADFNDSRSTDNVYFGACNNFSSKGCRMFFLKLTVEGVLTLDLEPVRFTNENGETEGAMYDRVSGELFRNRGTGAFVIGPDK